MCARWSCLFGFILGFSLALVLFSIGSYAQTVTVTAPTAGSPVWVGASGTSPHSCDAPNISVRFSWSGFKPGFHSVTINIGGVSKKFSTLLNGTHGDGELRTFAERLCGLSDGHYSVTVTLSNSPSTPVSGAQDSAVGIDLTPPTFSCAAPSSAWSASDVSRSCTASDSVSGLTSPPTFSLMTSVPNGTETDNALTNMATITDNAGNSVIAGPLGGNKVDKKAPVLQSCQAPDGLWHPDNVTLPCSYSDGGSGPASQTLSLSTSVPAGAEDVNAVASTSEQACDAVGNCTAATPILGHKIDKKTPQLLGCDNPDGLWHANNVTLACTYVDGGSGPASQILTLSTSVLAGIEDANASASTTNQACDAVGNCAPIPVSIVGNKIDRKPPAISDSRSPGPNPNGWNNSDVTVHFDCRDDGSGVASLTPDTILSRDRAGQAVSGTCTDGVGNSASTTIGNINIDKTEPVIVSKQTPEPNFYGWNNTDITVSFVCSDSGSGVASLTGPRIVRTEGLGQSRTGTCTDLADNSVSVTVSGINIDKTPPQVQALPNASPDEDGIYHGDVTVAFQGLDGVSGVADCSPPQIIASEGAGQAVEGRCVDHADNTATVSINLNLFKTIEPVILRLDLSRGEIPSVGGDVGVDLIIKKAPQGLSAYHLIFRVGEPGGQSLIARIVGIESRTIDPSYFRVIRQESHELEFNAQDVKDAIRPGDQPLPLARITLHVLSLGKTMLSLAYQVTEIIDDQGQIIPRSRIVLVPLQLEVNR